MTSIQCPYCGGRLEPVDDRIERRTAVLLEACRDGGFLVTADRRVSEAVAAQLLGRSPGTLANWAYSDSGPAYTKVNNRRTYRLNDLAEMLEGKK